MIIIARSIILGVPYNSYKNRLRYLKAVFIARIVVTDEGLSGEGASSDHRRSRAEGGAGEPATEY
jgi:hypothetical protein